MVGAASLSGLAYWLIRRTRRNEPALLDPDHWDARTDLTRVATQSWVLRSEGRVIVIDTGAGNGKYRPLQPIWSYLDTGYLAALAAAGVRPEDVDLVVNIRAAREGEEGGQADRRGTPQHVTPDIPGEGETQG